jgi:hypothetical protein
MWWNKIKALRLRAEQAEAERDWALQLLGQALDRVEQVERIHESTAAIADNALNIAHELEGHYTDLQQKMQRARTVHNN